MSKSTPSTSASEGFRAAWLDLIQEMQAAATDLAQLAELIIRMEDSAAGDALVLLASVGAEIATLEADLKATWFAADVDRLNGMLARVRELRKLLHAYIARSAKRRAG